MGDAARSPRIEGATETAEDVELVIRDSPLVVMFGTHARARIVMALLDAHPQPLEPASIVENAGLSRPSWYDNREELLASGLVEQVGQAGNSPLYGLNTEGGRVEALKRLRGEASKALEVAEDGDE